MKGKTFLKILLVVLFIAALGVLLGGIYRFTDGFNEDFKTMYLERNGEKLLSSMSTAHYDCGEEVSYAVKYTFPSGKDETRDFSAEITPNAKADFEFQIDGMTRYWRAQDLTKIFKIEKEDGGFSFFVPSPCRIQDVIERLYPDAESLTLPDELDREQDFYVLTVTSYNGSVSYTVNFSACETAHVFAVTYEVREKDGTVIPENGYTVKYDYIESVNIGPVARFTVILLNELVTPIRLDWTGANGKSGSIFPTRPSKPISPETWYFTLPLTTDCHCVIYLDYGLDPS